MKEYQSYLKNEEQIKYIIGLIKIKKIKDDEYNILFIA